MVFGTSAYSTTLGQQASAPPPALSVLGSQPSVDTEVDVLLIGAGLAGIGVAHHLQEKCPRSTYAILEARPSLGGTWDLFRYPGIRSDSRMPLYGYSFRPWRDERSLGPGEKILQYLEDTAREEGIDEEIHLGTRARRASWSSERKRWTVEAERADTKETITYRCKWLQFCSGYYAYREGFTPDFPGRGDFSGEVIHPQKWPRDFDATGKRIVVIGSGATAVTLIPSLAETAKHVVMLQRSPTYIYVEPGTDFLAQSLRRVLPETWAYKLTRKRLLLLEALGHQWARQRPEQFKRYLMKRLKKTLPRGFDVERHFTPRYEPWDQRVCLSPDGDLFQAISSGAASVVTDEIERFTPRGIRLKSGAELEADVIVTATGLNMLIGGEVEVDVDGEHVETRDRWIYKGVMLSGTPNMMLTSGTLVAAYTLRVELIADYLCRVLQHMEKTGARQATPTLPVPPSEMPSRPFVTGFSSGYLLRAIDAFPKQGASEPWVNLQTYRDNRRILGGPIDDGTLRFDATR